MTTADQWITALAETAPTRIDSIRMMEALAPLAQAGATYGTIWDDAYLSCRVALALAAYPDPGRRIVAWIDAAHDAAPADIATVGQ